MPITRYQSSHSSRDHIVATLEESKSGDYVLFSDIEFLLEAQGKAKSTIKSQSQAENL